MASGIALTDEIVQRVNSALADRKPLAVTYVDQEGRPHLSLRGSTHVHAPDQLAIWVRHAGRGLAGAVATNPALALLYRDADTRTTYVFNGRARVVDDEDVRFSGGLDTAIVDGGQVTILPAVAGGRV